MDQKSKVVSLLNVRPSVPGQVTGHRTFYKGPQGQEPNHSNGDLTARTQPELDPQLLTPRQAADYLGTSVKTLENWRGSGTGPIFVKLSAKCVRYQRHDLDAHILANRRRSTAES